MTKENIEKEWISKEGFKCHIVLQPIGHRCGYVEVDKNNLTNELNSYDDIYVDVHGGLTYGSNGTWGFDCAHCYDTPEKWNLEAVEKETNRLAEQLSKITWKDIIEAKLEYMPDWFKKRIKVKR